MPRPTPRRRVLDRVGSPIGEPQEESTAVAEQHRMVRRFPDTRELLMFHANNARRAAGLGELPESLLKERSDQRRRVLDPNAGDYDEWENLYTASSFPFIVGNVSQQIIPANPRRSYLLIQNKSAATMFINFGSGASAFIGFRLLVGESLPFTGGERGGSFCPADSIHVIGAAANQEGVIIEGVKINIGMGID